MKIITEDLAVFEILENSGYVLFDARVPLVLEFEYEENWHLLLFSPEGKFKGCKLFVIEKSVLSIEIESDLLPTILSFSETDGFEHIKNEALAIVEKLISHGTGQPRFFDAH